MVNDVGDTMTSTTTDENKELVHEYLAAWDDGEPDAISSLLADDFSTEYTDATGTDVTLQVEGFQDLVAGFFEAFAEFSSAVHEMVAEDDWVMIRITYAAIHEGEFLGVPATGNHIEVEEYLSFRIDEGKIVELHYLADNLDLLRQLDVELPIEG